MALFIEKSYFFPLNWFVTLSKKAAVPICIPSSNSMRVPGDPHLSQHFHSQFKKKHFSHLVGDILFVVLICKFYNAYLFCARLIFAYLGQFGKELISLKY